MKCPEFPPIGVCSNNGYCDETTGKCICNEGWSSIGDLAVEEGADCNINVKVIRALWIIDICAYILPLLITLRYFVKRIKKQQQCHNFLFDPSMTFPLAYLISCSCHIIVASIRLSALETRVIGKDFAATFFIAIAIGTSIISNSLYLHIASRFLAGYMVMMPPEARSRAARDSSFIANTIPAIVVIEIVGGLILMFCLVFPTHVFEIALASYILMSIAGSILCYLLVFRTLNPIIQEIEKYIRDTSKNISNHTNANYNNNSSGGGNGNGNQDNSLVIKDILRRLKNVKMVILMFGPMASLQFIIFGGWPLVSRNMSYIWPILATFGCSTTFGILTLAGASSKPAQASASVTSSKEPNKNNNDIQNINHHDVVPSAG